MRRMQSAECVCTELCVCLLFCYRLCEVIFLCRIYWMEVVGMERKAYWTAFFLLNVSKFQNSEQNLQLSWEWEKHSFCLFLTSERKSWALTIRERCDCWITFPPHLGWQLHSLCSLLPLDWWFWTLAIWWAGLNPYMTSPAMDFWPGLKFPLCKVHVKFN